VNLFRSSLSAVLALGLSATTLAQSWQHLANQPPFAASLPVLMMDGTVLVHDIESPNWWKFTPDINGDYIQGTWSQMASLPDGYTPLYYASAVLPDGRFVVQGGEYNGGPPVWTNKGAIYDPIANTWTSLAPPSGWSNIGDAQCTVLPDGTLVMANPFDTRMAAFDPLTLTWSNISNTNTKNDRHDEEGWTLLPDGTIFTVDCVNIGHSEKYIPWTGDWVDGGDVPVQLPDEDSEEMGPQVLMFDGRVMCFGATGHNAIYTPAANPTDAGTFTVAPDFPVEETTGLLYDIADGPAVLLTNGKILCFASPGVFNAPGAFFEFDGTDLTMVPNNDNGASEPSFVGNFLMLPSGQVMFTDFSGNIEVYSSSGGPNDAWRPTITSVPPIVGPNSTYLITGTQFNGFSQTNCYGDDWGNASNYPLVRITNIETGHVFYCRTANPSTMAVATNNVPVSTNFTVPDNIESGDSIVEVVANGIASAPTAVTVVPFVTKDFTTSSNLAFGDGSFTGTVILSGPAIPGGVTVNISSDDPSLIPPPNVTVPEGADHVDFPITVVNNTYGVFHATLTETYNADPSHSVNVAVYPANKATFVSQSVPSSMIAGHDYSVTLQYKNTSNLTWDAAHFYKLQSRNATNNTNFGTNRLFLTNAPVPPGGTGVFSATVSPLVDSGVYPFQWLPIEDAIGAGFGQLSPSVNVNVTRFTNDAKYISQTIPATVSAGNDFTVPITMKNVGASTWSAASGYQLSSINPTGNTLWRIPRMNLPTNVAKNLSANFSGICTAPITPGDYPMQWQMTLNGTPFGAQTPNVVIHVVTGPDNALFSGQSVLKSVGPGVSFSATIQMKNIGTGAWDSNYSLVPIGSSKFGVNKIAAPITSPNATGLFLPTFTAPLTPGTYTFQWRMSHNGNQFGQSSQSVTIVVSTDAAQYVSRTGSTTVTAGADFTPAYTMRNTGVSTWKQSTGFALLSMDPQNNTIWGTNRLLIPSSATVTTNTSVICSNTCTAPIVPGSYPMQWQMSKNGVPFGELTPIQTITVVAAADNAQFITQSVPTLVTHGATFNASITMKNVGTTTWDNTYTLVPIGQSSFGIASISGATTAPNGNKVFSATFTAPVSKGNFKFQMRMKHNGVFFGQPSTSVTITIN